MFQFGKTATALIAIIVCENFSGVGDWLLLIKIDIILCHFVVEAPRHLHLIIAVTQLFCFLITCSLVPNIADNQSEHQNILFLDSFSPEAQ